MMLVHQHPYGGSRSAAMSSSAPAKPSRKSVVTKPKKDKIHFVSKASLAIFDPRHAMGIDTGNDWYESPIQAYDVRHSSDSQQLNSDPNSSELTHGKWTADPTPELEAFSGSMEDYEAREPSVNQGVEMTRQSSASSSVFEDDREMSSAAPRKRFLSRKSVMPRPDDLVFSPPATTTRSVKPSSNSDAIPSSSSIARFFAWKKKDKQPQLPLATKSTSDLFDMIPQSAPPALVSFDQTYNMRPTRKDSNSSIGTDPTPSSLPTSPVRHPVRLVNDVSPSRNIPLSTKKSMPALRQIREAHNLRGRKSLIFEERSRTTEAPPALPPLPNFDAASPIIPLEYSWDTKSGSVRESHFIASNTRPTSRMVSSTGRGIPSPGLSPQRGYDSRKSTVSLRKHSVITISEPKNKTAGKLSRNAEKRMSMAQRVVDGLLDQNRGHEEPEMRSERTDIPIKAIRRRSRSADGWTMQSARSNFTSPPSSNSHHDSVFPAFMRHAPPPSSRSTSPQSHFFGHSEQVDGRTPVASSITSFVQRNSPSEPGRSPQRQASGETHQARRVNFANQRARAVAVSSPMLLGKSPRLTAQGVPLPVVNIMPPTPDLAVDAGAQERRQENIERQRRSFVAAADSATKADAAPESKPSPAAPKKDPAAKPVLVKTPVMKSRTESRQAIASPIHAASSTSVDSHNAYIAATSASPESVYSPGSIYSPEVMEASFSAAFAGMVSPKEELETLADSIALARSTRSHPRTDSVVSDLSDASSSSGAFAFSRSMSSSSLVSGGTYSSASSVASDSPARSLRKESSLASFNFSPSKMASSISLASTIGTSASVHETSLEKEADVMSPSTQYDLLMGQGKLRTPFQLDTSTFQPSNPDSSDCETPTLESCRQMRCAQKQPSPPATSNKLGLDMDLSDLAQELGLGRLSQIGLGHLKETRKLAEPEATKLAAGRKPMPPKPPKSSARTKSRTAEAPMAGRISLSDAISPLPSLVAGRSPQTPPRVKTSPNNAEYPLTIYPIQKDGDVNHTHSSTTKVSASGVPKVPGGFGLGLNFAESPSPTQSRYPTNRIARNVAAAVDAPFDQDHHMFLPNHRQHVDRQTFEQESEWVGVAM